jgi:addiction module HigA family antidote
MTHPHPGKILLQQYLIPQKVSQNALARAICVPPRRINEIVHEKRAITADTAVRLAIHFGGHASYWMKLQAEFEIDRVKPKIINQLNTIKKMPGAETPSPTEKNENHAENNNNSIKKRIMR